MNKDNIFLKKYFNEFKDLIVLSNYENNLIKLKNYLKDLKLKKNKALIFGNGGSSVIASHFSVDLTKNAKIRCVNFNEADLLTCFSNDYGYEKWVEKSIEYYADKGDLIILISSSGKSKNMINAAKFVKKNKVGKLITFTGNKKNNNLSKYSNLSFWVNSKSYNYIENLHQFLLLTVVDLIIGKKNYSSNR